MEVTARVGRVWGTVMLLVSSSGEVVSALHRLAHAPPSWADPCGSGVHKPGVCRKNRVVLE